MREIRPQAEQGIVWRNPKSIFKYNGWPSVCRDERGVLYATASSFRIQHVDPVGKNAMFVSFNDGKTWTRPIVVNDSYLDDRDTGVASLGDGKMIISWFSLRYDMRISSGKSPTIKRPFSAWAECASFSRRRR